MYTKKDRARDQGVAALLRLTLDNQRKLDRKLDRVLEAVGTVDQALRSLEQQELRPMADKLDAALEAAHDLGLGETIQTGIQNILNYTGAPKREGSE